MFDLRDRGAWRSPRRHARASVPHLGDKPGRTHGPLRQRPPLKNRGWLTLERLPAYTPELNPVEMLWPAIKTRELANVAGEHLADVADAAERGINRVCEEDRFPWSFLAHTGLEIHPPAPHN